MMSKRKLCTGVVVGAIVGGLVTLKNEEVRTYAKNKLAEVTTHVKLRLKNPVLSIRSLRVDLMKCRQYVDQGTEDTIQALEQIEQTLNKVIQKK